MTDLAASTNVFDLVSFANGATGGILLVLFVMAVFFVMLLSLKKYEFDSALLVSSFSCFMISIVLVYTETIPLLWALVYLIIAAFTAFYMFVIKSN